MVGNGSREWVDRVAGGGWDKLWVPGLILFLMYLDPSTKKLGRPLLYSIHSFKLEIPIQDFLPVKSLPQIQVAPLTDWGFTQGDL